MHHLVDSLLDRIPTNPQSQVTYLATITENAVNSSIISVSVIRRFCKTKIGEWLVWQSGTAVTPRERNSKLSLSIHFRDVSGGWREYYTTPTNILIAQLVFVAGEKYIADRKTKIRNEWSWECSVTMVGTVYYNSTNLTHQWWAQCTITVPTLHLNSGHCVGIKMKCIDPSHELTAPATVLH